MQDKASKLKLRAGSTKKETAFRKVYEVRGSPDNPPHHIRFSKVRNPDNWLGKATEPLFHDAEDCAMSHATTFDNCAMSCHVMW